MPYCSSDVKFFCSSYVIFVLFRVDKTAINNKIYNVCTIKTHDLIKKKFIKVLKNPNSASVTECSY